MVLDFINSTITKNIKMLKLNRSKLMSHLCQAIYSIHDRARLQCYGSQLR